MRTPAARPGPRSATPRLSGRRVDWTMGYFHYARRRAAHGRGGLRGGTGHPGRDLHAARGEQEIISLGDQCCLTVTVGEADRFLIRGFSWNSAHRPTGGVKNPFDLHEGSAGASGAKQFRLVNTRNRAGLNEYTAPQGATVEGDKTYTFVMGWDLGSGVQRLEGFLTRVHGTLSHDYDAPWANTVFSGYDDSSAGPQMAVLGVPLDAIVSNFGQPDSGFYSVGSTSAKVVSQGFTTGPHTSKYSFRARLQRPRLGRRGARRSSVGVGGRARRLQRQAGRQAVRPDQPTEHGPATASSRRRRARPWSRTPPMWWSGATSAERHHRLQKTGSNSEDPGALPGFTIADSFYLGRRREQPGRRPSRRLAGDHALLAGDHVCSASTGCPAAGRPSWPLR